MKSINFRFAMLTVLTLLTQTSAFAQSGWKTGDNLTPKTNQPSVAPVVSPGTGTTGTGGWNKVNIKPPLPAKVNPCIFDDGKTKTVCDQCPAGVRPGINLATIGYKSCTDFGTEPPLPLPAPVAKGCTNGKKDGKPIVVDCCEFPDGTDFETYVMNPDQISAKQLKCLQDSGIKGTGGVTDLVCPPVNPPKECYTWINGKRSNDTTECYYWKSPDGKQCLSLPPGTIMCPGKNGVQWQPCDAQQMTQGVHQGQQTGNLSVIPGSCQDTARDAVLNLIKRDNQGMLGLMYELTALRLAKRALEQTPQPTTLEASAKQSIDDLIAKTKINPDFEKQVGEVYKQNGRMADLTKSMGLYENGLAGLSSKVEKANYFKCNNRFNNDEASALILTTCLTEGKFNSDTGACSADDANKVYGLSDIDAATVWIVEKARKDAGFALGTENGNLLNISTRVARYLGDIDSVNKYTPEEVDAEIQKQVAQINGALKASVDKIMNDPKGFDVVNSDKSVTHFQNLAECFKSQNNNQECPDCMSQFKSSVGYENSFEDLQRELLKSISTKEQLKLDQTLHGKLTEGGKDVADVDLSNFAKDVRPKKDRRTKTVCEDLANAHPAPDHIASSANPRRTPASNTVVDPKSKISYQVKRVGQNYQLFSYSRKSKRWVPFQAISKDQLESRFGKKRAQELERSLAGKQTSLKE